jgi:flagellar protein FliS
LRYSNLAFEYQKQAANTASPVGLVVMLYDGALRFMEAGKAAVIKQDLKDQDFNLQKAQKIVLHLMATLDLEKGGTVSTNLLSLYRYVLEQLVQANVHDQVEPIDNAIRTMSQLRSGWNELDIRLKAKGVETAVAA